MPDKAIPINWHDKYLEAEDQLRQEREATGEAWKNRDHFCHWLNEIGRLFWGDDKQCYSPEAVHRQVAQLQTTVGQLCEAGNRVIGCKNSQLGAAFGELRRIIDAATCPAPEENRK